MEKQQKLSVSSSPHAHCGETTASVMQDVLIALMPAALMAVIYFGWYAALLIALCVGTCVLTEYICRRVMRRPQTIGDFSAAVTGVLLALNLPPALNPLYAVLGSVFAIVVVKQMFGGIGMNFVNPALAGRIFLLVSFPSAMSRWLIPFYYLSDNADTDLVTTATPLARMAAGNGRPAYTDLLIGMQGGCIGETCTLALLLGGAYLLLRRVISPEIPLCFLGTVALTAFAAGQNPLVHVLSGGAVLGAVFMATDYATCPVNRAGKIVYGIGCGLITMTIRLFGALPEGVSYAIVLMNILTPHIETLTLASPFGSEVKNRGE